MKHYAHRKGGYAATPDGFDRSDPFTLASLIDEWFLHLEERNYAAKTVSTHSWSLKMFLSWAQERDLNRPEEITKPILESYQRWLYRYRKANDQPLGRHHPARAVGIASELLRLALQKQSPHRESRRRS